MDGDKQKGRSRKTWGECVKNDLKHLGFYFGTGLGTRSREVERLNMWNPSNPCMHGQRTLNDNDDDDELYLRRLAAWRSRL